MIDFLKGKKTYIIAALMMLVGLVKFLSGDITFLEFIQTDDVLYILNSLGLGTLRAGVKKSGSNAGMMLIIPLLMFSSVVINGCSGVNIALDDSTEEMEFTEEPKELTDVVEFIYAGYYEYHNAVSSGTVYPVDITLRMFVKLKNALNNYPHILVEIQSLTDDEILKLVNIGDKYDIGPTREKFKQIVKMTLFLTQTYFLYKSDEVVVNENIILTG